ncbi:MAG: guanylate kinase [Bacteroidales bacterium]|jgi:guanylate kinase|nr:guanylate kinase [Bacteroidales bacterium]MDD3700398.1 guanylate kinase [Bacteroidales bacterium]MDY0368716.1 guanylate kinase [Bacteroidales bacterium]
MATNQGKLIIISAPSGGGKTTLVSYVLSMIPELTFSISATSRPKRAHEIEGKDYYFLTNEQFKEKIINQEFVEWEEVYDGLFYGTLKGVVERTLDSGQHLIFDVDVIGGLNIKKQFGDQALSIFISPPDLLILEQRLRSRSTDTEESIRQRIQKAAQEMEYAASFDVVLINDQLDPAKAEILAIINRFLNHV